jgi:outer membrane protein TolC
MWRKALSILLAGIVIFTGVPVFPSEHLSLDKLIQETREHNPDILAAKKRWEASLARIPQAKSLDNPNLGLSFEKIPRNTFQIDNTMPADRMLTLSQFFPLFGKLSLRGKISLLESQMAAAEYRNKELEIINQVKNAYFDLFMNHQQIELNQHSLGLLIGIVKVAEARYSTGVISQEQVYKINLELAKLNTVILNLKQEQSAQQTRLNTLLNRNPESPLGIPKLYEDVSFSPDIRSLYQSVLLNQPGLAVFSYAIERNTYAKSLAKRSFFPDLMSQITLRGISSGTIGPWDIMLAFSVPLWFWTKQRYELKEAIANLEEAKSAYEGMKNKVFSEVKDLAIKIEIAKNKIELSKTSLMPILESSIESSLAAFRSGEGDFMALLDNQRMLIETKMDYYRALVEYNMNLADLERTIGKELK